ncbi:dienelactone hydrolase [Sphingomonas koreensis]|nr:dienelactone hydrolase [Sphingomonas koreensis]
MMTRWMAGLLALAAPVAAQTSDPSPIAADAPELAPRGALPVGTQTMTFTDPNRTDVLKPVAGGGFARDARILPITIWYPADAAATGRQRITYSMPAPFLGGRKSDPDLMLSFPGQAARDAAPAAGRFPLVVLSHGYNNRAVGFSDLAENLASKGYVVISIEHGDIDPAVTGSPQTSFLGVLINRSADQRFVIGQVARRAAEDRSGVFAHIDAARMALAGYSMGGYGAITSAGAGYDPTSPVMAMVPKGLLAGSMEADDKPVPGLKALILFGPWGGAPTTRMWTPAALARITAPTLMIDGDRDDIVDYAQGTHWLFDQMAGSDRYLLTYREARHNIAMNAAPPSVANDYLYIDKFNEPVWGKGRILAINTHMITAFLDLHLKGMSDRASYLNVPTASADDGVWPLKEGEASGAAYAQPTGPTATYWRGFHRRWALGIALDYDAPAKGGAHGTR